VPLEPFKPLHGLRQGDPLSPYLFLFVADGLSRLMQRKVDQGNLDQLHVCRCAPGISHLLFADDTLMFLKIKEQQAMVINTVLGQYEQGTGQLVNPAKCSIMFGKNCEDADKERTKEILNVSHVAEDEKYLGLPTPQGRMSKEWFKPTKERLVKCLTSWDERCMSTGAKEVLIKSVPQAIPTYVMGVFMLPPTLCDEMTRMIRYIWWG
jgi:hypothetical protein